MKFDANTLTVLKNFAAINKNILFREGNKIRTIAAESQAVMASYTSDTEITEQFAIYDLSRFLGTISLFDNPDLTVNGNVIEIREGNNKYNYVLSDPSLILSAPDKDVNFPEADVKFALTDAALTKVQRALGIGQLPEIAIVGANGKISVQAIDSKGASQDTFSIEVGDTDKNFVFYYRSENIKLLPGDYEVAISSRGLSHFKGKNVDYWIAVEANSKYDG